MVGRSVGRKRRITGIATGCLILLTTTVSASNIYQWRDANGRLHFGDTPPEHALSDDLSGHYHTSLPFEIRIEGLDYAVPPPLRDRLIVAVSRIFDIYQQALSIEHHDAREFRILIYGREQDFRAYQQQVAPILENAAGFYSSRNNQITTWAMADERTLLQLIIHECSHAISASGGRYIPTWLNEGLAEYFELMQLHGLSADIPVSPHWLAVLRKQDSGQRRGHLARVINAAHQDWYAANGPDNLSYAVSWSLVWYLMDSADGRTLIRQLLHETQPGNSSLSIINQHWPGGFAALEAGWQQWLRSANGRHRY
jgi:hypothetical protein